MGAEAAVNRLERMGLEFRAVATVGLFIAAALSVGDDM